MAIDGQFATGINNASALLGAAETNLQVPTTTSVIVTAGANGTKIEEISVQASATSLVASTVAGLVYLFLFDGTTYRLYDTIAVRLITAASTVAPYRSLPSDFASGVSRPPNLVIKSGSSLRASQSIAGNASILVCSAFAGDL